MSNPYYPAGSDDSYAPWNREDADRVCENCGCENDELVDWRSYDFYTHRYESALICSGCMPRCAAPLVDCQEYPVSPQHVHCLKHELEVIHYCLEREKEKGADAEILAMYAKDLAALLPYMKEAA